MRYILIIKALRRRPVNFDEISNFLGLESEIQGYDLTVSKRTFQRDLNDIRSIFNIHIQYDSSGHVYFIEDDQQSAFNNRLMEAFDVFNALNIADRLSDRVHFEKQRPRGTENLYGLLHAINNQFKVIFYYNKYWEEDDKISRRETDPLALKEFKNRWYVLARDLKDGRVKSFGLDRLSGLEITGVRFSYPDEFDVHEHFKYCFGIVGPNDDKPEEIILSFNPKQGKYVKSLPLHESQEILKETQEELLVRLTVYVTYDLYMEILSFGENVKVVQPGHLAETVKSTFEEALNLYSK